MDASSLTKIAKEYLDKLCYQIPNRRVGSAGNRLATTYFAETMKSCGFEVECTEFECMDWENEGALISAENKTYPAQVSPYSLGIQATAPLIVACSAAELETLEISNKIVLMRGELTKEQFLPKNFPFFQVEEQQRIFQLLEAKKPQAILTATTRNPEMAGGVYPFPVFADGDFDIPSAFLTEGQGNQLAKQAGKDVSLSLKSKRLPSHACNLTARKGQNAHSAGRVVLCAHIDAKYSTPGALDNGTGIVTLLLLAELLKGYAGDRTIEIVALNGEDYYSNPGEQLFLLQNEGKFHEITLGINIDGLGYVKGQTAYSLYECPPEMTKLVEKVFAQNAAFVAGEPWFQGDHALFLMNQRPALALTSELAPELMAEFIHTDRDTPEIVDPQKVVMAALALHELVTNL
ncbi:MAG TPA: M28 family peptidase [Anaerolineales bacterium]|nr:M28 family peptidase [Anaerolineales bacterium]